MIETRRNTPVASSTQNQRRLGSRAALIGGFGALLVLMAIISVAVIAEQAEMTVHKVKGLLTQLGWHSVPGGSGGHSPWHRDNGQPCPYDTKKRAINLDKAPEPDKPPKLGIADVVSFLKAKSVDFPILEAEVLQDADRLGISDGMLRKGMKRLGATVKNGMMVIPGPGINPAVVQIN